MGRGPLAVLATVMVAVAAAPATSGCGPWTWANPLPQGNHLTALAAGGGGVVAVGDTGTLLHSADDGVHWTRVDTGLDEQLVDIDWSGHDFVAVSTWHILTSGDGVSWTVYDPTPLFAAYGIDWKLEGVALRSVAASPTSAYVSAMRYTVLRRDQAGGWAISRLGDGASFDALIWTGTQWVGVGGGVIGTSPDGDDWTWRYVSTYTLNALAFGGGRHVAVGSIPTGFGRIPVSVTSSDGKHWSEHRHPDLGDPLDLRSLTWDGARFVTVGYDGFTATSPDGVTWQPSASGVDDDLEALTSSPAGVVAAGAWGLLLTAPDGASWTVRRSGPTDWLYGLAVSPLGLVAVGRFGAALTSSDGVSWERHASGSEQTLLAVTWADERLVAVGREGTVLVSDDGAAWAPESVPSTATLLGVAAGGGRLVAVGTDGTILERAGGGWTASPSPTTEALYGVAARDDRMVAVGAHGTILVGDRGGTWSVAASGVDDWLYAVAGGAPGWVAVGSSGAILHSPTGDTWTRIAGGGQDAFDAIAWDGSRYTAVSGGGRLWSSRDGVSWRKERSPTANWLRGVAVSDGVRFAVGDGGTVLASPCSRDPRRRSRRRAGP